MTTTATFSNGHSDTYQGNRPVTAAWAIICTTGGKVLASGHSLDRAKAEKTAHSNASDKFSGLHPVFAPRGNTIAHIRLEQSAARHLGWDGKGVARKVIDAENARCAAERAKLYRVEVVDL